MIRVRVTGGKGSVRSIRISGHAYAGDPGEDLICAAVSSIGIGTLNALEELAPETCKPELGEDIRISVRESTNTVQTILETMLVQLGTIAEKYPKNMKIDRKE